MEYRGGHSALGTPSAKNARRIPTAKSVFHPQSPYSNHKVISQGSISPAYVQIDPPLRAPSIVAQRFD